MGLDERARLVVADDGAVAWQSPQGEWDPQTTWLLGIAAGGPRFAQVRADAAGTALREAGARLDADDETLATTAVALAHWHANAGFCPRCGGPTTVIAAGFARRCERCDRELFPRQDPAMIVSVLDDEDRLLLAHQATWPDGRYSVLAGFCEAGESLEQCVRREVAEEVGATLADVRYLASQPWPVPRSLMTAFAARATTHELRPDGDEITSARWFTRDELRAAVAGGEIIRPASRSVSAWMIDRWLAGELSVAGIRAQT